MKTKPTRIKHPMHIEIMNTSALIFTPEYKKVLDEMVQGLVDKGGAQDYVELVGFIEKNLRKEDKTLSIISLSFVLSRFLTDEKSRRAIEELKESSDISIQ